MTSFKLPFLPYIFVNVIVYRFLIRKFFLRKKTILSSPPPSCYSTLTTGPCKQNRCEISSIILRGWRCSGSGHSTTARIQKWELKFMASMRICGPWMNSPYVTVIIWAIIYKTPNCVPSMVCVLPVTLWKHWKVLEMIWDLICFGKKCWHMPRDWMSQPFIDRGPNQDLYRTILDMGRAKKQSTHAPKIFTANIILKLSIRWSSGRRSFW